MDYDGDGDLDILSGSYTGEVYLFVRDADGSFAQGVFLKNADGGPLQTGTSITPEAHDLDGDGDLDLLIGTRSSGAFFHENVGTRTEPRIAAKGTQLKTAKGTGIKGSNAHYADWDHDGVRDLILGSERGDVLWHKNLGGNAAPRFDEAARLIDIDQFGFEKIQRDAGPSHPGSRTKVHATDWNGDGRIDLLVGDVRWLYYTENPLTEAEAREKAELEPRRNALLQEYLDLSRKRSPHLRKKEPVPEELEQRYEAAKAAYQAISQEMRAYQRDKSETHGYVWLYLRGGEQAGANSTVRSEPTSAGPAKLVTEATQKGDGDSFEVTLRLQIDDGWHSYGEVPPQGGYPKTAPALQLPKGFTQVGGFVTKGTTIPATDGSGAMWFLGEVLFQVTVRRDAGAKGTLQGSVSLQVCNDQLCLPQQTLKASLDL